MAAPFPDGTAADPAADGHRRPGTEMHLRPCGLLAGWSAALGCSASRAACTWPGVPHTRPRLPITRLRARCDVWRVHWATAYPAPLSLDTPPPEGRPGPSRSQSCVCHNEPSSAGLLANSGRWRSAGDCWQGQWPCWWPDGCAGGLMAVLVTPWPCRWPNGRAGDPMAVSVTWWLDGHAGGPRAMPVAR